jgi:hypothetical protein
MNTSSQSKKVPKTMPRWLTTRLVATFDLLESLRSRKAIVLLLLYFLGALGASAIFIRILTAIKERLEEEVGRSVDMVQLWSNPGMERVMGALAGDAEVAKAIVQIPPMALFYGWLAMNFVPLLVLFTSADAISGDLSSGAVRFSIFRADRLSWALGKLIGQTCMMMVGVLTGALACWFIGLIWLEGFSPGATAWWLLRISGRTMVYSFAYLGMVMCASEITRTGIRAGGLALGIMFFNSLAGGIVQAGPIMDIAPQFFLAVSKLFPNGHYLELWHPRWLVSGPAMVGLVLIGLAYFALGFLRFGRRDA